MSHMAEVRERLAREDDAFQRLAAKHQEYERRLDELKDLLYLSPEEQVEEVKLKKLKLSLKDEMERLVRNAVASA